MAPNEGDLVRHTVERLVVTLRSLEEKEQFNESLLSTIDEVSEKHLRNWKDGAMLVRVKQQRISGCVTEIERDLQHFRNKLCDRLRNYLLGYEHLPQHKNLLAALNLPPEMVAQVRGGGSFSRDTRHSVSAPPPAALVARRTQLQKQEKQNKVDTEGVIRVTVSGRHPKPVTQKYNERGKFWKEKTLKKDEVLGTVNYELSLRLDSSPKDIRDELLKHFNVKEEAKECHNLLLSTTDEKRTSFKLANFKQLKDLNLDKLKPVLHVKFKLKSKAEMLALSDSLPVKRIEKRCSQRLAHQNDKNAANIERTTKAMNKADVAAKKEKGRKRELKKKPAGADL